MKIILICMCVFVFLPILTYFIAKFGTCGYYKAKRLNKKLEKNRAKKIALKP